MQKTYTAWVSDKLFGFFDRFAVKNNEIKEFLLNNRYISTVHLGKYPS